MAETDFPVARVADEVAVRTRPSLYPAQFAARVEGRAKRALGEAFGLANFGVNRVTMAPGTASALRHAHTRQDEFVYILEGSPVLVTNAGETQLSPGMCAGFRAGSGDAHHLLNRSQEVVVYLEVGDRTPGDAVSYPDDDLMAVPGEDGRWRMLHKDGTPWDRAGR